jgi:hypothetical protein
LGKKIPKKKKEKFTMEQLKISKKFGDIRQ